MSRTSVTLFNGSDNGRTSWTANSATAGNPDKLADLISDAILDAVLKGDPLGRVSCQVLVTTGICVVAGEVTCNSYVDVPRVARETIRDVGFTDAALGFDFKTCGVLNTIQSQSPDIAMGVDTGGAGDSGSFIGFACDETPELMPLPIQLSHQLTLRLAEARRLGIVPFLRPDGKAQVTVEYDQDRPVRVQTVVISTQHDEDVTTLDVRKEVRRHVIDAVIPREMVDATTQYFINPTGRFVIGGPHGDTGITGRQVAMDTYGGAVRYTSGALSGVDATKVDRSGAYMARYIAKNIVAAGLATRIEVCLSYAIGVAEPTNISVRTFGTGLVPDRSIVPLIREFFPLTPRGIIDTLRLRRPIYRATSVHGHFGRENESFSWERTDKVHDLRHAVLDIQGTTASQSSR